MPLGHYRAKRDFAQTTEPSGDVHLPPGCRFVVQQHAARRMHYDFRLEIGGVLKSWAVPKGPSLNPRDKRLAVPTEDHPTSYASFEGQIPKGSYGGGNVIVWDAGTWEVPGDVAQQLKKGHLHVILHGQKLLGAWSLIRIGEQNAWLLRKLDDAFADPTRDITTDSPLSILRGCRVENVHKSEPVTRKKATRQRPRAAAERRVDKVARDPLPATLKPQLATLAASLPTTRGWAFELKYDGYRLLARKQGSNVCLLTRNGHDWTARFAPIAQAIAALACDQVVLDGELVVTNKDGRSDFAALQAALHTGDTTPLVYCIFDVLALGGLDLRDLALSRRRTALEALYGAAPAGAPLHLVAQTTQLADAKRLYAAACANGMEGLVANQTAAPYESRRSDSWLKIKCRRTTEVVVGGFTRRAGSPHALAALLVGHADGAGGLRYMGRVGSGLGPKSAPGLWEALQPLRAARSPFTPEARVEAAACTFVRPVLVIEVAYLEMLASGALRHARFVGLRPDKDAAEVVRDGQANKAVSSGEAFGADVALHAQAPRVVAAANATAPALMVTHPNARVAPGTQVTKANLVAYVRAASDLMLAHAGHRPLSLVRCPNQDLTQQFFQRHLSPLWPGFTSVRSGGKHYPVLTGPQGLLACVQHRALEWHTWGCTQADMRHPDRLTFDLDPGAGVGHAQVIAAAVSMRDVLAKLDLQAWLKVTGGKGLHLVIPIAPRRTWRQTKAFCRFVAEYVAHQDASHFTAVMAKAQRHGRVYIDYLRNHEGATAIAPYACRARPGLPIARPLAWEDLTEKTLSQPWGVPEMRRALKKGYADPWQAGPDFRAQVLTCLMCDEALKYIEAH